MKERKKIVKFPIFNYSVEIVVTTDIQTSRKIMNKTNNKGVGSQPIITRPPVTMPRPKLR